MLVLHQIHHIKTVIFYKMQYEKVPSIIPGVFTHSKFATFFRNIKVGVFTQGFEMYKRGWDDLHLFTICWIYND